MSADLDLSALMLAVRVAAYLNNRYPGERLKFMTRNLMGDDRMLAAALLDYRLTAKWPQVDDLSGVRCVTCHKVLLDGASACEDEDVCTRCAQRVLREASSESPR